MGTDYRAKLILAIPVSLHELVETVQVPNVKCDHPMAEGMKFCPICGTPANLRSVMVTRERAFPAFAEVLRDLSEDEDEEAYKTGLHEHGWFEQQLRYGYITFKGGIEIVDLNENPKKPHWVLGIELGASDSSRSGGGYDETGMKVLTAQATKLTEFAAKLGIAGREVSAICKLGIS